MKICRNGNHSLEVIYANCVFGSGNGCEEEVVRWCKFCGAIVVDFDFDGRTSPGGVMKMKFPQVTKNLTERTKQ